MTRVSARQAQQLGILTEKKERPKKLDKPPLKEGQIQAAIRDWLRWHKWLVIRNHQTLGSHKGLSDLVALKGGRVLWIEVKRSAGVLSPDQEDFRDEILAHGGEYLVVRSVEDVERYLKLSAAAGREVGDQ